MRISVVGCGKLGLSMTAYYASKGHNVIAIDNNEDVIAKLNNSECHIQEPGLKELLDSTRHNIIYSHNYLSTVITDLCFVIVPTPTDDTGEFSNDYILQVLPKIESNVIVIVSTVKLGSMRSFSKLTTKALIYNPEFVALGSVIHDMSQPDMLLIGEEYEDSREGSLLVDFFHQTYNGLIPTIHRMTWENAEVAKLSLNCTITTKISIANTIAEVCSKIPSGNIDKITNFLGDDRRIGKKYFTGGLPFSGTCFPRDNRAFVQMANRIGTKPFIQQAVDNFNTQYQHTIIDNIEQLITEDTKKISLLGVAYKTGTPVTEESIAISIAEYFTDTYGVEIGVYDKLAKLPNTVSYNTIEECLTNSDLAIILLQEMEFKKLPTELMRTKIIYDAWRWIDKSSLTSDVKYYALGINNE